jgi:hypothetical protein
MILKNYKLPLGILSLFLMLILSCQDPISVGNDLLDDQKLNVGEVDTFDLSTFTIAGSRVTTYQPNIDSRSYMIGQMNDQVFGKTTAELFLKFQMPAVKPTYSTEIGLRFDSLVLTMLYDTVVTYGASNSSQKIEIFQLDKSYSEKDTFYSDTNLSFNSSSIANVIRGVSPRDSVSIVDHVSAKSVKLPPHLRVRLNDDFGKALINNLDAARNDTLFNEYLKGFKLTSSATDNSSFLYGFNFSNAALTTQNSINKLIMYYTVASGDTTLRKTYEYQIHSATINRFIHAWQGSLLERTTKDPILSNDQTFLQPMGGVKTKINIKNLNKWQEKLINKAELVVYVAEPSGKDGFNSPPPQMTVAFKTNEGKLLLIQDISQLISANTDFSQYFGGGLDDSKSVFKYTMNITNHIKSVIKDNTKTDTEIYLGILTESEIPRRAVLYGAKHPIYPMKLKLTYTKN